MVPAASIKAIDLQSDIGPFVEAVTTICADFGGVVRVEAQNVTGDAMRDLSRLFHPARIQVWWKSQRPLRDEVGVLSIDLLTFVHETNIAVFHNWSATAGVRHAG